MAGRPTVRACVRAGVRVRACACVCACVCACAYVRARACASQRQTHTSAKLTPTISRTPPGLLARCCLPPGPGRLPSEASFNLVGWN